MTDETKTTAAPADDMTGVRSSTVVRWEDELSARRLVEDTGPSSVPVARARIIQPALYEVGVSSEGMSLHCVLMESSGDPASDEAARVWIMARRFQPQPQSQSVEAISWGRVLVLWGANAISAMPAASTHPSQPSAKP